MLKGDQAHASFESSVEEFPLDKIGIRPAGLPHSAWELLEHLRITQNDILRFSQSGDYKSPQWPEGYWPTPPAPAATGEWEASIHAYKKDFAEFTQWILDSSNDLYEPLPWGEGQNLLREALLVMEHNSYHLGQLLLVRRALGAWSK